MIFYIFVNGVNLHNEAIKIYKNGVSDYLKKYPSYFENQVDNEYYNINESIEG